MSAAKQRRVLVTGGSSGIGAAIAERFLMNGDRVAVLDRNPMTDPPDVSTGSIELLVGDVSDAAAVDDCFARLDRMWGGVDIVFNNAGISIREPFLEVTPESWERTIAVNLTGVFLVAQRAARRMMAAGSGVIINTGSVSGMVGMPGYASYNVTKAGVIELTKTMALELAPRIRVNSICPGYVLTPMQEAEYTPEMIRDCESKIPLRRLGRPTEIAALGVYLASDDAHFVTGQSFVIDGGETAGGLASA